MNITIIGGGKLGYNLAKQVSESGKANITLIEKKYEKCLKISEELNITVINGDGTDPKFLAEAGIEDTDIFIIVTGNDEINFVSFEIVNKLFNHEKIIVRVNNVKNKEIFEKIGVDAIISPTEIMTREITLDIDNLIKEREQENE